MNKFHVMLATFTVGILLGGHANAQSLRPTPPPEPSIRPIVAAPVGADANGNRLEDVIDDQLTSARKILKQRGFSAQSVTAARNIMDKPVMLEFVFSKQITQQQIDDFLAAGGTFTRIFQKVGYGWTGMIPRSKVADVATSMGKSLLVIREGKPMQLHMDEAAGNGRVRPVVWDEGIEGDGSGPDRITIAILDTGVDGSHTDLAGREEYWKDFTSDGYTTPTDRYHHGSHVAGIALGTGAAFSANPTQLKYTEHGVIPVSGFLASESPIHMPLSVTNFNWSSTMYWETDQGVTKARVFQLATDGPDSYQGIASSADSTLSPITISDSHHNPYPFHSGSNTYTGAVLKRAGTGGAAHFVINNTIDYAAPGDGYSALRGVAPDCHWAGYKVFTDAGAGADLDIEMALDDLVTNADVYNIKVANMSLGEDGSPGINTTLRAKVNTAAMNGVVMVVSAGNGGQGGSTGARQTDDPGRAQYAITVGAVNDLNQITWYSSEGFAVGDAIPGDQDMKPDLVAPGGSNYQSLILSVDSNNGDEGTLTDHVPNDYTGMQGTSMSAPFISGCVALVIDAMQRDGLVWHHNGSEALADVLRVKMMLLMTATETGKVRETPTSAGSPTLDRGGKDIQEGYGMVNADAAVEAYTNAPYDTDVMATDSFAVTNADSGRRCWARRVNLDNGDVINLVLDVPSAGDYDVYLYSGTPDAYGNPQILASSVSSGNGTDEILNYSSTQTETGYLVVKRVSGNGVWTLSGSLPVSLSAYSLE